MSKLNKLIENAIKAIPTRPKLAESRSQRIIRRLREDSAYQEFFQKALTKFGVSSPADFDTDAEKKEFFNYVDNNYSAKSEAYVRGKWDMSKSSSSSGGSYFPTHSADSPEVKKAKQALARWFDNIKKNLPGSMSRNVLDDLSDLIDDYAMAYAQDEFDAAEKDMSRNLGDEMNRRSINIK